MSAVVPTHGNRKSLQACLEALVDQPDLAQIVVVVDGPSESASRTLAALGDDRIQAVELATNQGRSVARRTGLAHCTSKFVLLVDDDVIIDSGVVSAHLTHHRRADRLVVVGDLTTPVPDPLQMGDFTTKLYEDEHSATVAKWERDPDSILQSLWGGHLSMALADARVLMNADLDQFDYHEDTVVGLLAKQSGLSAIFDRTLGATHRHSRSFDGFLADARAVGRARVELARRFPNLAGQYLPNASISGLSLALRVAIRVVDRLPVAERLLRILTSVIRRPALELTIGRFLRRVHQYKAARLAQ